MDVTHSYGSLDANLNGKTLSIHHNCVDIYIILAHNITLPHASNQNRVSQVLNYTEAVFSQSRVREMLQILKLHPTSYTYIFFQHGTQIERGIQRTVGCKPDSSSQSGEYELQSAGPLSVLRRGIIQMDQPSLAFRRG